MSYPEQEILGLIDLSRCPSCEIYLDYYQRIVAGSLSKEENPDSHFCVYFLPYNPKRNEVFLVLHKKSGLWLCPGGHIDKDESPRTTLRREILEELGIKIRVPKNTKPFLLTVTKIPTRTNQTCHKHFDLWYYLNTDGKNFKIDMREFFDTGWFTMKKALEKVGDEQNREALRKIQKIFSLAL